MSDVISFEGRILRSVYMTDDFKIYAMTVDRALYPSLHHNEYGNITICGNLHQLAVGSLYKIVAKEKKNNRGVMYDVVNIKRDKPLTREASMDFLFEILTYNQAKELLDAYPNIIEKVIKNDLNDIDLQKTKGIKEKMFEKIKQSIIDNFCIAEMIEEFGNLLNFKILKRLYEKYPSTKKVKEKISSNPYKCLCGISGIGFKTADVIIQEFDFKSKQMIKDGKEPSVSFDFDIMTSPYRLQSCLMYLLEENEKEGHTYMTLKKLKDDSYDLTPECHQHFADVLKEMMDESIKVNRKGQVFRLSTYLKAVYCADKTLKALEVNDKWDIDTTLYEESLTKDQAKLLQAVCNNQITILSGYAGTGKSYTTSSLIKMLENNNKSYYIFAPTGRASKVIGEYTNRPALTIHRGLGYKPPSTWHYNETNPIRADIIIVDEFSMVDIHLFSRLYQGLNLTKSRLLLIGDPEQLPSVGCGNILYDLIESKKIPTVTLTEVFRYGRGGIDTVATNVRNSQKYLMNDFEIQTYGEDKGFVYIPSEDHEIISKLKAVYKKLLDSGVRPENIGVISSYNKGQYGTVAINKFLQQLANKKNVFEGHGVAYGETTYYKGDLILQTVNNYNAKIHKDSGFDMDETTYVFNGEIGRVVDTQINKAIIHFDDDIVYNNDSLNTVKLGYSISCHKAQGGGFDYVIFLTPRAHQYMLNANLLYVGITRTKKKCFQIGDYATISRVLKKKINRIRQTELQDLLRDKDFVESEMQIFRSNITRMLQPQESK